MKCLPKRQLSCGVHVCNFTSGESSFDLTLARSSSKSAMVSMETSLTSVEFYHPIHYTWSSATDMKYSHWFAVVAIMGGGLVNYSWDFFFTCEDVLIGLSCSVRVQACVCSFCRHLPRRSHGYYTNCPGIKQFADLCLCPSC